MNKVSVADLRRTLPSLLRAVEQGHSIEVTRRGRPIAVVLSLEEYKRLQRPRESFVERLERWHAEHGPLEGPDPWADLRDSDPPREVEF